MKQVLRFIPRIGSRINKVESICTSFSGEWVTSFPKNVLKSPKIPKHVNCFYIIFVSKILWKTSLLSLKDSLLKNLKNIISEEKSHKKTHQNFLKRKIYLQLFRFSLNFRFNFLGNTFLWTRSSLVLVNIARTSFP